MEETTAAPATGILSPGFSPIIHQLSGNMKFVGILTIVIGALYSLTIVGAILGIPYIFAGMRLKESADSMKDYLHYNDSRSLEYALERQNRFFNIVKILFVIGLVIGVLYIIGMIVFLSALDGFSSSGYSV